MALSHAHSRSVRRWRAPALLALAALSVSAPALAANVDLTASVTLPSGGQTLQPFDFTVTYGNSQLGVSSPATNAGIAIALPANLSNVTVVSSVASGAAGAVCPAAPGGFTGVPTGTTTGTTPAITATIANLPQNAFCTVTLRVTPLVGATYSVSSSIAAGAGDSETNARTNTTGGNVTITRTPVRIGVKKEIISGATMGAPTTNNIQLYTGAWNTPIVYKLTYTNDSDVDLRVADLGGGWNDAESVNPGAQVRPTAATTVLGAPGHPACESTDPASVCPTVTANANQTAPYYATNPIAMGTANAVVKAKSSVSVYYTRTYTPPMCGSSIIDDNATWPTSSDRVDVTYISNNLNSFVTRTTLPALTACAGTRVDPKVSKVLTRVENAAGVAYPAPAAGTNFMIREDGDAAIYTIVVTGDANVSLPFRLHERFVNIAQGVDQPTFRPSGSVTYGIEVLSCDKTGATTTCPAGPSGWQGAYPQVLTANRAANSNYSLGSTQYPSFVVDAGGTVTLTLRVRYKTPPNVCRARVDTMGNWVTAYVEQDANAGTGSIYTGNLQPGANTTSTPLELFTATQPRCVDLTANKTMSTSTPKFGDPFSFYLDYTNSTALNSGLVNPPVTPAQIATLAAVNPLKDLPVQDVLGAHFVPTAVSCATTAGTATPPPVSLADITGPDNTFNAVIPSMEDGAVVRCTITGSSTYAGSFKNVTNIGLPASATGLMDFSPNNNVSDVNYGVLGPMVQLTKTASAATPFTPGAPLTYNVVVASVGGVAADGTVVTDNPPPALQSPTWTCTASGGAVCPAASGSGAINQTIATFPSGGTVTYAITGTAAVGSTSITNTAEAVPPTGGACATGTGTAPPPCKDSATVGGGANAPYVSIAKSGGGTVKPGDTTTFTVTANAVGVFPADGAVVSDPIPANVASQTWTCVASGGAVCPAANGSGAINQTIATFPGGSSVVYTVVATVAQGLADKTKITNIATIAPPPSGSCDTCSGQAIVEVTNPIQDVPVDAPWMLAALAGLLTLLGGGALRRRLS